MIILIILVQGKYIKRAVKDFGTKAFTREVLETFDHDESLSSDYGKE
jgi:hypothetical protein